PDSSDARPPASDAPPPSEFAGASCGAGSSPPLHPAASTASANSAPTSRVRAERRGGALGDTRYLTARATWPGPRYVRRPGMPPTKRTGTTRRGEGGYEGGGAQVTAAHPEGAGRAHGPRAAGPPRGLLRARPVRPGHRSGDRTGNETIGDGGDHGDGPGTG